MALETTELKAPRSRVAEVSRPLHVEFAKSGDHREHGLLRALGGGEFEILDSNELALRLKVKESWVVEQSKRSRTSDPIPIFRLGKHRRYRWGSPEMNDWLARRVGNTTQRKIWS